MLRIAVMNMILHDIQCVDIEYRNSLSRKQMPLENHISLLLANPPFRGSIVQDEIHPDLLAEANTTKSNCFFTFFYKILKVNGRAAVVVPDGVLSGSGTAYVHAPEKKLLKSTFCRALFLAFRCISAI